MNAVSIDNTSYLAVPINEIQLECQPKNRDRPLLDQCENKMAYIKDKILILFEENKQAENKRETKCYQIRRKWKHVKITFVLSSFILSWIPYAIFFPLRRHYENDNDPANQCSGECRAFTVLAAVGTPIMFGILALIYLKICLPKFQRKEHLETDAVCREYSTHFQRIQQKLRAKNIDDSDLYKNDPTLPNIYKRFSNREYLKHASLLFESQILSSKGTSDLGGDLKIEEEKKQSGDDESNNYYSNELYKFMIRPETHQSVLYNQVFHRTLEDELNIHRVPKALINIICDYTAEFGPLETFENLR